VLALQVLFGLAGLVVVGQKPMEVFQVQLVVDRVMVEPEVVVLVVAAMLDMEDQEIQVALDRATSDMVGL
jgi:hypothetical protein